MQNINVTLASEFTKQVVSAATRRFGRGRAMETMNEDGIGSVAIDLEPDAPRHRFGIPQELRLNLVMLFDAEMAVHFSTSSSFNHETFARVLKAAETKPDLLQVSTPTRNVPTYEMRINGLDTARLREQAEFVIDALGESLGNTGPASHL